MSNNEEIDCYEALRFMGLAENFWQLTLNVAEELIKRGNPGSMEFQGWQVPSKEDFKEHTKWSDTNIVEPTLFIFYHGIELSLKALILAKKEKFENVHGLSGLLEKVKCLYGDLKFAEFYEKYISSEKMPKVIEAFCSRSGITIDLYYQSLKYPTSTKYVEFNHSMLRGKESEGISLFGGIYEDLVVAKKDIKECVIHEYGNLIRNNNAKSCLD